MKLFPVYTNHQYLMWLVSSVTSLLLFLLFVVETALLIRQKRYKYMAVLCPLLVFTYFMEQSFTMAIVNQAKSTLSAKMIIAFLSLPDSVLLLILFLFTAVTVLLLKNVFSYERNNITNMSIKEAIDSLPAGLLCYTPAQILLSNYRMQELCRRITGKELINGEEYCKEIYAGELLPACHRFLTGEEAVILLEDGKAFKFSKGTMPYENHIVNTLLASDITENYQKTLKLQQLQDKVTKLGNQLQKVNREIVTLTAGKEVLNASIRIHDELGANLLSLRKFLMDGGEEKEKKKLVENLHRSVSFLKNDISEEEKNEYELLLSTAKQLGVDIVIEGQLPQSDPHKTVLVTAIHECFTNTLRHARGRKLFVKIIEGNENITAVFTNDGKQPQDKLEETGGLLSLRTLTVSVGGRIAVNIRPEFSIVITLPKEGKDVL